MFPSADSAEEVRAIGWREPASFGVPYKAAFDATGVFRLQEFLNSNFLVWNIAAGLAQPVFNAGSLKARVALAEAHKDQAIAEFAGAALIAFREVETTLKNEEYLKKQEAALKEAVYESQAAEAKALEDYSGGLVEIITLLTAQRRTFQVQSELIGIQSELLENRVALYLALGGGFRDQ